MPETHPAAQSFDLLNVWQLQVRMSRASHGWGRIVFDVVQLSSVVSETVTREATAPGLVWPETTSPTSQPRRQQPTGPLAS